MTNKSRLNKWINIAQFAKSDLVWKTILWKEKILQKKINERERTKQRYKMKV